MRRILFVFTLLLTVKAGAFLPPENYLTWWLYRLETCTQTPLPGTLPGSFVIHCSDDTPLEGICRLITSRSIYPGRMTIFSLASGQDMRAGGMIAGQVLSDNSLQSRLGATVHFRATIARNLFFDERLSLWTGSDELPPATFPVFHAGAEKGRHLYVDWGYLSWEADPLSLLVGRIPQRWGPGRFTQLLLSTNSPALDMLKVSLEMGSLFTFSGLTATVSSDSGTYLVAHRLDLTPARSLRIGLSEAILFRSEGLELAYMNPVIPWYPVQWNERDDDNAFISFDALWKPFSGLAVYGEFLIDDIQYENQGGFPDKLGWTLGADWAHPGSGLAGVVEYTRIDRYVYGQRRECNYYLHDGVIIGSDLGPDADRITLSTGSATFWPFTSVITLNHTRHGEGSVAEGWPDSVQATGSFPSGTVEHSTGAVLDLSYFHSDWLEVHGSISRSWVRNLDNVHGVSDTKTGGSFEVIWHY
jgi:hypothetical protein